MNAAPPRPTRSVDAATGEIIDAPPQQRMLANAPPAVNIGALIQIEQQRAIAEVQARSLMARANPRDPIRVVDLILGDCQRLGLAEHAAYEYSRGGADIRGASIFRLLEAIARRWGNGNLVTGVRELSRRDEREQSAGGLCHRPGDWLLRRAHIPRETLARHEEGRLRGQRRARHLRARRERRRAPQARLPRDRHPGRGRRPGARAVRGRRCCARADTSAAAVAKMVEGFAVFGVTRAQIEQRLQRRLDAITPAQLVGLRRVYASLRDGMSASRSRSGSQPAAAAPEPPTRRFGASSAPGRAEGTGPSEEGRRSAENRARTIDGQGDGVDRGASASPAAAPGAPALEPRTVQEYQDDIERASDAETAATTCSTRRAAAYRRGGRSRSWPRPGARSEGTAP